MKLLTKKATHQPFWQSKRFWLIATPIIVLLVVSGLGLWSALNSRQAYLQQEATWRGHYAGIIEQAKQQLQEGEDSASQKAIKSLQTLQTNLENWRPPQVPNFLGINLVDRAITDRHNAISQQKSKVLERISRTKDLLAYQAQIEPIIASLSGKSTKNLEELKALAADWQAKSTQLSELATPDEFKPTQQAIAGQVNESAALLQAMIPLYEKQDVAGFATKQRELAQKIDTIKAQAPAATEVFADQDNQLQVLLQELKQTAS